MIGGYVAKFDWFILKPLDIAGFVVSVVYLVHSAWLVGLLLLLLTFAIGMVASGLHRTTSTADLAAGHPRARLAFRREVEPLGADESNRIAKATMRLAGLLGCATLVLSLHHGLRWSYAIPLSIAFAWLALPLVGLLFGGVVFLFKQSDA
jgi:hypothetical protein